MIKHIRFIQYAICLSLVFSLTHAKNAKNALQNEADSTQYDIKITQGGGKNEPITIKTRYCKGTELRCGLMTKTNHKGIVIFKAQFENDKYHGAVLSYFNDGKIREERTYAHGKEQGLRKTYYNNGKMQITQEYADNKREGEGKKFYESGALQEVFSYQNNVREGLREEFDKAGGLTYQTLYKNGKKQWIKRYNIQGEIIEERKCGWQTCY